VVNGSEFLVTGGTGSLGSRVVDRLRGAGREVQVFSRRGGEGRVRGDLATGEGLEAAVQSVETIIRCASSTTSTRQVDVEGTERLLGTASRRASRTFFPSPSSA
jgi:nucleoside-diphosphate-sugar epimerase